MESVFFRLDGKLSRDFLDASGALFFFRLFRRKNEIDALCGALRDTSTAGGAFRSIHRGEVLLDLYGIFRTDSRTEATSDTADRTDFFDIRSSPRRVAGHVDERLLRDQGQDRFWTRGNTSTTADALERVDGDEPILDGKSSKYTDLHAGPEAHATERTCVGRASRQDGGGTTILDSFVDCIAR